MPTIAASSAINSPGSLLPQHQAALTVLQARLSVPHTTELSWLDLACGRGQILMSLGKIISAEGRRKIAFWAYDINQSYARETQRAAAPLGFASVHVDVGELAAFDLVLPRESRFDFITLTNAIHEIEPTQVVKLLAACIARLSGEGILFAYDMDRVAPLELGATPWDRDDARTILWGLLDGLGATTYRPEVGLWPHRTCNGWNIQIERKHLGVSPLDISNRQAEAVEKMRGELTSILRRRLSECSTALETMTQHGVETSEEQSDKERLLHEFWALTRALGRAS